MTDGGHPSLRQAMIQAGPTVIDVLHGGVGRSVLLLPPLGRSRTDLFGLTDRLMGAGYRVILPEYRGIGQSSGPMADVTLHDLADDIAEVIGVLDVAPACILGVTFGSRLARVVAADYPDLVLATILLGAGGRIPADPRVAQAAAIIYDPSQPREARLQALGEAFFAEGNDPAVWEEGWHLPTTGMLLAADAATPVDDWWRGGDAPALILQGAEDIAAPPENGRMLRADMGDRATLIDVPNAAHALLAEQPARITEAVLAFLDTL